MAYGNRQIGKFQEFVESLKILIELGQEVYVVGSTSSQTTLSALKTLGVTAETSPLKSTNKSDPFRKRDTERIIGFSIKLKKL